MPRFRTVALAALVVVLIFSLNFEFGITGEFRPCDESSSYQESSPPLPSEKSLEESPESLCEALGTHSALHFWTSHQDQLLEASRGALDRKFVLRDSTAELLQIMTPRLPLGQRSLPRDSKSVEALVDKLNQRWRFLRNENKTKSERIQPPPPVRIVVLGGSVTMGINCVTPIKHYSNRNCAWPIRLENLINKVAGGKLVVVDNLASGGTNTDIGRVLLEYDLLPQAVMADVIINAYSTNDMHINTIRDASNKNSTLRDYVFGFAQDFVRTVGQKCHQPLLLWFDDYLGNEQRKILDTTELSQGIQVLANYYGFGFVSYADTVRDLVYGKTRETVFSPGGWYKTRSKNMKREIHPGFTMHLSAGYTVAYYLLQMVTHTCQLKASTMHENQILSSKTGGGGLASFRLLPDPRRAALPPHLDAALSLETISEDWRTLDESSSSSPCTSVTNGQTRCPFAWFVGVWNPSENPMKYATQYFEPVLVQPSEWEYKDDTGKKDPRKYGFLPKNGTGSTMTLDFSFEDSAIRTVTVFYLKSYGDKWANSSATVRVLSARASDPLLVRANATLLGFHDKETSETYTTVISLDEEAGKSPPASNKERVRIELELVAGETFKMLGIAVCR